MKTSGRVSVLAVLAVLAFFSIPDGRLEAQSTFGSVRGTAMDQTGAAIPGARVTLRSLDESTEVTSQTAIPKAISSSRISSLAITR